MSSHGVGEHFVKNFRTDDPAPLVVREPCFAAARVVRASHDHGISEIRPQNAFVFACLLQDFSGGELWIGGVQVKWQAARRGQARLYDLRGGVKANITASLDFVYLYLPRAALDHFTDEHELPRVTDCTIGGGTAFSDPTISEIANALLPALARPTEASQLHIDRLGMRLQHQFINRYTSITKPRVWFRGGLAPRQERRVKELMYACVDKPPSIERLAAECGLSRSHFFRAFCRTFGMTPHRFLTFIRIEKSKLLLLHSDLPLAAIATTLGFANPSHFTRTFSAHVGATPAAWRASVRN